MNAILIQLGPQLPEALMALAVAMTVFLDLVTPATRKREVAAFALIAVVTVLGFVLSGCGTAGHAATAGLFAVDGITGLARIGILGATALAIAAAAGSRSIAAGEVQVFAIGLLGMGLGALVCASATSLLTLFIGLEAMSLPSYALAGLGRRDRAASEAGMKYVMYGALATGLGLFGMALLYGLAGTLDLAGIGAALRTLPASVIAAPCALAAASIAFKLALVPLHAYAPDVYQGAPTVAAGAFSVIPKLAAFAVLARAMTLVAPPAHTGDAALALAVVGTTTLLVGSLAALAQRDARRILAYSAIGHAGTMLLAFALWPGRSGLAALAWYLFAYAFMNLGAFTALGVLIDDRSGDGAALAGTWRRRPWIAASLALSLVALAGIPPLSGFFAKWLVVRELAAAGLGPGQGWLLVLAAILLLGAVAAAVAYLRVVRALFADDSDEVPPQPLPPVAAGTVVVLLVCIGADLLLGVTLPLVESFRTWLAP